MIRTRVAPSPTGYPHIGTIYQAIFDYAFARRYDGKFIVRIEDTDRTRFVAGAEDAVLNALEWFDLSPDESPQKPGEYGPYRQSERLDIYKKRSNELLNTFLPMLPSNEGEEDNQSHYSAYYCFCSKERLTELREEQQAKKQVPHYDKHCLTISRSEAVEKIKHNEYVVRLNVPANYILTFNDWLTGEIAVQSNDVDDQVLIKADGFPTYHLAAVVDDYEMKITHIFRGKEWLPSTPKHLILYYYFNWERPTFIHLPLILNSDGKGKMSKRHGHTSVDYYKEEGFLAKAMVNYLINIVWNHPEEKEIFSIKEFWEKIHIQELGGTVKVSANTNEERKEIVSLGGEEKFLSSQGPRFDLDKLRWINQQYIQNELTDDELKAEIITFYPTAEKLDKDLFTKLLPLLKSRMVTLKDFASLTGVFFDAVPEVLFTEDEKKLGKALGSQLESLDAWNKEAILERMRGLLSEHKVRMSVFYKLLTGHERGLPLPDILELLGKEKTLALLNNVI